MAHVLRLHTASTITDLMAAIKRIHAERIALFVPLGMHTDLANSAQLQALHLYCAGLGKEVAFIGGNAALRAAAVTAGFVAAIALEDWQTDPMLAVVRAPQRRHRRHQSQPVAETIHLLGLDPTEWDDYSAEDDDWDEELPAYVQLLMRSEGSFPGLHDETPAERERRPRITHPLRQLSDEEALRQSDESHEDRITLAIRDTANLPIVPGPAQTRKEGRHNPFEPPAL